MAKFNHDEIRDTLRIHERTQNISATAREFGVKRETVRNRLRYATSTVTPGMLEAA